MSKMRYQTLIVVQCRSGSTRLRGKALYPLCGIPVLTFLLKRLKNSLHDNNSIIVLGTTTSKDDDILEAWALAEGIQTVRGDEDDVLSRYIKCLDCFPSETIVRVTADNPLTCPEILKWLVQKQQEKKVQYVQCENLPYGAGIDVFSYDVLKILDREAVRSDEREHINLYILKNQETFKTLFLKIEGPLARPDLCMTIDTSEEWKNVKSIFNPKDNEPWGLALSEIIKRMDNKSI